MPKVPDLNLPQAPKRKDVLIVCTTNGKPLPPEDQKALEEYIAWRKARGKKHSRPPRT